LAARAPVRTIEPVNRLVAPLAIERFMKLRIGKRQVWLLCGLLLALPVAHAKKSQDEDSERQQRDQQQYDQQQSERSAPVRGGYLEKDKPRNTTKSNRESRRNAPQPQSQPRYDNGYERRDSNRNYVPEQRYEPAPRYESAPRYAPRQMNLSEAVAAAERSTGGRVLSAEPIDEGGRLLYRVKVLTPNGRVSVLYLDAQ
jgi:uncharacterized membrane protein YkoI